MQNVKNTMLDALLSWLAPHPCISCGAIGALLCDECKKYIIEMKDPSRPPLPEYIDELYITGRRQGALQRLVDGYKFFSVQESARVIAECMAASLPLLNDAVLVEVPTSRVHVRLRGFDHTVAIVRHLSRITGLANAPVLARHAHYVQHKSTRAQRYRQVAGTIRCTERLDPRSTYVVVDDVLTTGASLSEAARALKEAGAARVIAVVLVWQPLRHSK